MVDILKEKGMPIEKQIRCWHDIVKRPYKREGVDCYTRTRQILLNGIETEAWGFKHCWVRKSDDVELNKLLVNIRRIEDMQQTTINWLSPYKQTILDTTLGYEQVAVDLTAWLSQNEDDPYVKETFDFGLLEDFDHLYRYSQFANIIEETDPNEILQGQTDVVIGRPTQYHHNDNSLRIRKHYDKNTATPRTKVNILTLISGEQQTHNYYAEHGFMYGNTDLKRLYAEICDVEEEHVTMYESLIDPNETMFEKWLIHELTEASCYYNCYADEKDERMKLIFEEMFQMEMGHLHQAIKMFEKYEKKDAASVIGDKIIHPCHFESQKEYVKKVLNNEVNKRVDADGTYNTVDKLPSDWKSYKVQNEVSKSGAPSEQAINLAIESFERDIALADNSLLKSQSKLLEKSLEKEAVAPNTICVEEYEQFNAIKNDNYLY